MAGGYAKTIFVLFLLAAPLAYGQEESGGDEIEAELLFLEEELSASDVISASKKRQSIFWSPSAVTVLTREDILDSGATTLPDLMRLVPGFHVLYSKPSYSMMGCRGLIARNNNSVLLLIDGREEPIELTGFSFWNSVAIDLQEIERIEVVRGPGSTLYGPNAFDSVVNITTTGGSRRDREEFLISGGEHGGTRLFAGSRRSLALGDGTLSYRLGVGNETSQAFSDPETTELQVLRSHGQLHYQSPGGLDLSLHAGMSYGDGSLQIMYGDIIIKDMLRIWEMAKIAMTFGETGRAALQFYHYRQDLMLHHRVILSGFGVELFEFEPYNWLSDSLDAQLQLEWSPLKSLQLIGGAIARYSALVADKLNLSADQEFRAGGFLHLNWELFEHLQLNAGARVDYSSLPSEVIFSPRLVLVYHPVAQHSFRLGYGRAFRKPSMFESQVHFEVNPNLVNPAFPEIIDMMDRELGNPDLTSITMDSIEAGWLSRLLDEKLALGLDAYFNIYSDVLDFDFDVPMVMGLPDLRRGSLKWIHLGFQVWTFGAELSVSYDVTSDLRLSGFLSLNRLALPDEDAKELPAQAGQTARVVESQAPLIRARVQATYHPQEGFFASATLLYMSSYKQWLVEPVDVINLTPFWELGEKLLLIGQFGHRSRLGPEQFLELGLTVFTPLGAPYYEFPGSQAPNWLKIEDGSDFMGEQLTRRLSFFLRGTF